jgi:8-oxo-dGTP diphosphatase
VLPPHRRLNDSNRSLKAVRTVFRAEIVGGELTPERDGSTDEARWFTLDEVRGLDRVSIVDISLRLAGLV